MGIIKKLGDFSGRIVESTGEYSRDAALFGSAVARAKWKNKIKGSATKNTVETLASYVQSVLTPLTRTYSAVGYESLLCPKMDIKEIPIWFCWWQGEEYMPRTVRLCYSRALHLAPGAAKIHLVTLKNVKDYIDFPPVIEEKYYQRDLHLQALTDILRASLLCAYGGVWMDPMLYMARPIDEAVLRSEFYSQKLHYSVQNDPSKGLWNSRFMVVRENSVLMNYIREAFTLWWNEFESVIDERQFDYFMLNAYRELDDVAGLIDSVEPADISIGALQLLLNEPVSVARYRALEAQCPVFDISADSQWKLQTASGEETLFGYLYHKEFET